MKTDTKLYKLYQESRIAGGNKKLSMNVRYSEELQSILKAETDFLSNNATLSERLYCWLHNIHEIQMCPYCNEKPLLYRGKIDKGYYATCGRQECKSKGMSTYKNISLEKRKEMVRKGQETYFKHTGYKNIFQNPERFKELRKEFKEKHGVEYPLQIKEFKEKQEKTTIERYGTLDFSKMPKAQQTIAERYGSIAEMRKQFIEQRTKTQKQNKYNIIVQHLNTLDFEVLEYNDNTKNFKLKCKKCGLEFVISRQGINYNFRNNRRFCPKCDFKNMTFRSLEEQDLANFINTLYHKEILYNKKYNSNEFDICLPEEHIAFDYNGIYWHSTASGKENGYHLNKKIIAKKLGFKLFYVWEDLWMNEQKRNIIESNIKQLLGIYEKTIYATNCIIKEINIDNTKSIKELETFLRANDLDGNISNGYRFFGMYHNNRLVMVSVISKTDNDTKIINNKHYDFILSRLTVKTNYRIVNGIDKMLKYIINLPEITNLIYFINLDWNDFKPKDVFINNGFINTKDIKIFRKQKNSITRTIVAKNTIDDTNILDFWDAGNLVLTYNKEK